MFALTILLGLSPFLPSIYLDALKASYAAFGQVENLTSSMKVFGSALFISGNYFQNNRDSNANVLYFVGVIALTVTMWCYHPALGEYCLESLREQKEVLFLISGSALVWCFVLILPTAGFVALAPLSGAICLTLVALEKMSLFSLGSFTAAVGQLASSGFLFGNSWVYIFRQKPTMLQQFGSLCKVFGSLFLFTANAINMDWQNMKGDDAYVVVTATNLFLILLTITLYSYWKGNTSETKSSKEEESLLKKQAEKSPKKNEKKHRKK